MVLQKKLGLIEFIIMDVFKEIQRGSKILVSIANDDKEYGGNRS